MKTNTLLKTKIFESGKSQIEVASLLGMNDGNFSKIVNGWRIPKIGMRRKIAKILKCKIKDIFPLKDDKELNPSIKDMADFKDGKEKPKKERKAKEACEDRF